MRKILIWTPIIGAILIIADPWFNYNLSRHDAYPEGKFASAILGPWHGITTGYPLCLLILKGFGVI